MDATWDDLVYENSDPLSPPLTSTNWSDWNTAVLNSLKPYQRATSILNGNIKAGTPSNGDCTIDIELFTLLMKGQSEDTLTIGLDAKARHGISEPHATAGDIESVASDTEGSKAALLEQSFQTAEKEGASEQMTLMSSDLGSDSPEQASDALLSTDPNATPRPSGDSDVWTEKKEQIGVAKKSSNPIVPTKDSPFDVDKSPGKDATDIAAFANQMYQDLDKLKIPLKIDVWIEEWHMWAAKLRAKIWKYGPASEILQGTIEEGHPNYSSKINEYLFDIISVHCGRGDFSRGWGDCKQLINTIYLRYGKKGSRLYAALREEAQSGVKARFKRELKQELEMTTQIEDLRYRMSYMRASLRKIEISLTQDEINQYSQMIGSRFWKATQEQISAVISDTTAK